MIYPGPYNITRPKGMFRSLIWNTEPCSVIIAETHGVHHVAVSSDIVRGLRLLAVVESIKTAIKEGYSAIETMHASITQIHATTLVDTEGLVKVADMQLHRLELLRQTLKSITSIQLKPMETQP